MLVESKRNNNLPLLVAICVKCLEKYLMHFWARDGHDHLHLPDVLRPLQLTVHKKYLNDYSYTTVLSLCASHGSQ